MHASRQTETATKSETERARRLTLLGRGERRGAPVINVASGLPPRYVVSLISLHGNWRRLSELLNLR